MKFFFIFFSCKGNIQFSLHQQNDGQILKNNFSNLTLKQPSDIRWENLIDAVHPLQYQLGEIYYTLYEIMENENYTKEMQYEA